MRYVGLDVHQCRTTVATLDDGTGEVARTSIPTVELAAQLSEYPGEQRIVLEAGGNSWFVAQQLLTCGWEVMVVPPAKARPILATYGRAMTDRRDAEALVRAFARGQLDHAAIWVPGPWIADLRELTRTREQLVKPGTRTRVAIRQALQRWGEGCPYNDLLGKRAQAWLDALEPRLRPAQRLVLVGLRRTLAARAAEIEALSRASEARVQVAQHFANSRATRELRLRRWFARLVYAHGANPAKVALARRLLDIIFALLRDQTTFDLERCAPAA